MGIFFCRFPVKQTGYKLSLQSRKSNLNWRHRYIETSFLVLIPKEWAAGSNPSGKKLICRFTSIRLKHIYACSFVVTWMGVFRLLCQAESRRLLLLMAITFALVLAVQYFELPYTEVFTSLFAAGKNGSFPTGWSSSKSGMFDNVTLSNGLNSTHNYADNDTENGTAVLNIDIETAQGNESEEKDRDLKNVYVSESNEGSNNSFGLLFNGSSSDTLIASSISSTMENGDNVVNAPVLHATPEQQNVTQDYNASTSSGSFGRDFAAPASPPLKSPSILPDTKLRSNMSSVNTSSVGKNTTILPEKHEDPNFLISTPVSGNVYSENTVPAVTKKGSKKPKMKSKKQPQIVVSISEMNDLLLQSHTSPHSVAPPLSSKVQQEVIFAKSQIMHAPVMTNDSGLHPSLYRNVSMFKRSYELMENILKVYIYQEGEKPIFHQGILEAKHPFWNRTGGADHFLVACHDWAPAETRGRFLNSIRALCNADIGVGFTIGKDVSLPETYVHSAKDPQKSQGGNPSSQRHILAFFAGNMHGYVRPVLLNYWRNDPDMKIFGPMPHVKGNINYIEHMKSSKFCICARGHEVNSP
ncbi:uncharacterized protein LOC110410860 isoform X3 [Herrania umbratica]|uniref:Uncharacterized protein LOC110410860 isoform X3 n=1 Tax=Herrania umbratica TaxID=108875 RepID=A0A6J0ZPF9_9ROSI|nr:uncharacterized protein LOC110410860 isoform X3 [Herrania umbratica]